MAKDKVHTETVEVEGDHLLAKIKEIVHEGNVSLPDYYLHPLQPLRMVAGDCQYSLRFGIPSPGCASLMQLRYSAWVEVLRIVAKTGWRCQERDGGERDST